MTDLARWEVLIARCDELEIEELFLDLMEHDGRLADQLRPEYRAALRRIDELKIGGGYEVERARLARAADEAGEWPLFPSRLFQGFQRSLVESGWRNLLDGIKSPDEDQRARFQTFWDAWDVGESDLDDPRMLALLPALERAKRPAGRPGIDAPWRNVVKAMDEMRLLVGAEKISIPEAAWAAALGEGTGGVERRAKRFSALYRRRVALRTINPDEI